MKEAYVAQLSDEEKSLNEQLDQFEEDKKNLSIMLRGSSNQRVIDVNKSLKNNNIVMYEVG